MAQSNMGRSMPTVRRELLWNVSQPGDPYDIKRSMIAKMPGDKKVFMGEHLELVCLLQAAQIERLCQFLDDYKLRFRQIERSNLDRHSYQVQIKELTQKLADDESGRGDNTKLVQFIKKQQAEIEYLQGISRDSNVSVDGMKQTYERCLEMNNQLTNQNSQLRQHLQEIRNEFGNLRARYEALERSKNLQIQQIRSGFAQSSRDSYETGLNAVRLQFQGEIRKYDLEAKRLKELNEAKNAEINDLMRQRDELTRKLSASESNTDFQRQVYDYENKFVMLGQQIERLNIALRDYANKIEESEAKKRELERTVERSEYEKRDLDGRLKSNMSQISHLNQVINKYEQQIRRQGESQASQSEQQISALRRQINELTSKLRYESQASRKYKEQSEKLNFQNSKYRLLEKDNLELRNQIEELNTNRRKIVEYENRIAIMMEQFERLKSIIQSREAELERIRSVANQSEANKSRLRDMESSLVSKYEYEINRLKTDYEQKIQLINRSKGSELQGKSQLYESQLDKMRETLRIRSQEAELYRQKVYELETMISRNELEVSTKIRNYESSISALRRQNEELFNKSKLLSQNDRKVYELQSIIQQLERELQRLNQANRVKEQQLVAVRSRLREAEGATQHYQSDINRQIAVYEQNISGLKNQNENYKRRLTDASQQIERLNQNIRRLIEEKKQVELSLRQLSQKSSIDNQELVRRIAEFESRVNSSTVQLRGTEQENETLKRQLTESKLLITRYENEINNLSGNMEQTLTNAGRQNEQLRGRVGEYETALTKMSQQLARLNQILRNKKEDYQKLEINYRNLRIQYDTATQQFKEYQFTVKSKFEGQFTQTINNLRNQNEDLRRRLNESDNSLRKNIDDLQRKIQQQDLLIRQKVDECVRLDKLLKDANEEKENIIWQWKQSQKMLNGKYSQEYRLKSIQYEQNINRAQNQIADLIRRLQEVGGDSSRKLRQLQSRYAQLNQQYEKVRSNVNLLSQQNDGLKRKNEGYEVSIANYEIEVKRRFQSADESMTALRQDNDELRRRLQQFGELSRKLSEYESRIALLSQEIQRVQSIVRDQNQQIDNLRRQLQQKKANSSQYELQMSQRIQSLQQDISILERDNIEYKRRIPQYEQRCSGLSQQLQRVNNAYRTKTEQCVNMEQSFKVNYEQMILQIKRQNEELNRKLKDTSDVNRQRAELENKIVIMNQQIQRLQQIINKQQGQINRLDQIARNQDKELESWRHKCEDIEINYRRTLDIQVTQKYTLYEKTINELNLRNSEFENKLVGAMQQIERLNNVLRLKVEQSSQLSSKITSLTSEINQYERRIRETQNYSSQNVTALRAERDQLTRRLQQWEVQWRQNEQSTERRIVEYENKLKIMNEQLIRLGQLLTTRTKELQTSKRQFKQFQDEYSIKIRDNSGQYEAQIDNFQKETYELKRRLAEYESKVGLMNQDIQKLNGLLRSKTEELSRYETSYSNLQREHDELRRRWQEINEVTRRVPEYQQKLNQLLKQNEKLQQLLAGKNEELNSTHGRVRQQQSELETLRRQVNEYQNEVRSRVSGYEQNVSQLKRQNQQLTRRRSELESKIALLSQQHERVSLALKTRNDQYLKLSQEYENYKRSQQTEFQTNYKTLHQNYTLVTNEYEVAKKHLIDYEGSIRKLHGQFQRLQTILQELKKERDSLVEKNRVLSEEIKRLNGLNIDLEEQARDVRLRLSDETTLQKRISQHLSLMVVLFAEIETLRMRVREKEQEVVQVRKSSLAPHMV